MSDPSPAENPETTNAPASDSPGTSAPTGGGNRRAVIFVAVFLVTTFVLLGAFQFLTHTVWMQRYLFVIAGHTATALSWVTETSYLEVPSEDELPMDERAQVHAEIDAWRQGVPAPILPEGERNTGPALTRWDRFQHRTLWEKFEAAEELGMVHSLAENTRPEMFDNPEHHIEFLTERSERLDAAIYRTIPGGRIRERAEPQVIEMHRTARAMLDELTDAPFTLTEESFQRLRTIDEMLEMAWREQLQYAHERVAYLNQFVENSGPMVIVVWDRGAQGRLDIAREELTRIVTDARLSNAERVEQAEAMRAEIRELEEALGALMLEDAPPEAIHGKQFRFTVIPECGAIETMAIYIAAILGFPTRWWRRLAGIALGIPLLYAVNIFRLACLGLIGAWFQDDRIFDFAHHYVWQAIYLVFVVVVWLLWMELLVRRGEKSSRADA